MLEMYAVRIIDEGLDRHIDAVGEDGQRCVQERDNDVLG